MDRSHIFIVSIALVVIVVVIGTAQLHSQRPTENENTDIDEYATFSSPTNIFESLQRNSDNTLSTLKSNELQSKTAEQLQAIQNIIQTWEARAGSSDARIARASLSTLDQKTPEQSEKEEITTLFNSLIGTKIIDVLAQQSGLGTSNDDIIWLGGYTNTQNTVQDDVQSDTQVALHTYGNELGALLTTFNISHGDQVNLLDKFIKNQNDTTNLRELTDGYLQLSSEINDLVPPVQLSSVHTGLISSYANVGKLLWELSYATNDEELLARMLTYNKTSEEVAKNHVSLVTLFKANGVIFKTYEAGSIFSFNPGSGGEF